MNFLESEEKSIFDDREIAAWLGFERLSGIGIGIKRVEKLFEYFGNLKEAWVAQERELKEAGLTDEIISAFLVKRKTIDVDKLLETCKKARVDPYPYYHLNYPQLLRHISDPPMILFVRGSLEPHHFNYSIGVVGTRKPSAYGRAVAKEFGIGLAKRGVTVVSGLAVGVDSLAHHGAIEADGRTIGVLACGPDICYPSSNKPLYEKLITGAHGAVVSEFFPGTKPEPWHFPARNRIISGLARGVVVIEAGEESGALITAEISFNQGHVPFAVPGRIDNPMSAGTNRLIKQQKATMVTCVNDIMKELNWQSAPGGTPELPDVIQLFGRENEIFELVSNEPIHFDHLSYKSGMAAGELSATLTMLELAGIVIRHPGDWYSRSSALALISSSEMP